MGLEPEGLREEAGMDPVGGEIDGIGDQHAQEGEAEQPLSHW